MTLEEDTNSSQSDPLTMKLRCHFTLPRSRSQSSADTPNSNSEHMTNIFNGPETIIKFESNKDRNFQSIQSTKANDSYSEPHDHKEIK